MSDLLSIGASGVRAYQSALGTVSDNIANANTPGYTRRATTLAEVTSTSGGITQARAVEQNGVLATGVSRSADAFKAAAVRVAGSDLARTQTAATWLTQVQGALTGNDLGDRLTGFFTAATTLSADPTSTAARSALLEAPSRARAARSIRRRRTSTGPRTTRRPSSTGSVPRSPRSMTGSAASHPGARRARGWRTSATSCSNR